MSQNTDDIRAGYEAFGRGDLEYIKGMLAPDVTWHVPGRSVLAGTYQGIDAVIGYFGRLFEMSGGTFRAELIECGDLAPELVGCLVRITGDMPNGRIDERIIQTFARRDGRTTEVRGYAEEPYAIDEAIGASISLPAARTAGTPAAATT